MAGEHRVALAHACRGRLVLDAFERTTLGRQRIKPLLLQNLQTSLLSNTQALTPIAPKHVEPIEPTARTTAETDYKTRTRA